MLYIGCKNMNGVSGSWRWKAQRTVSGGCELELRSPPREIPILEESSDIHGRALQSLIFVLVPVHYQEHYVLSLLMKTQVR